jgi:orotidine-5'-phosphate decarboxylase
VAELIGELNSYPNPIPKSLAAAMTTIATTIPASSNAAPTTPASNIAAPAPLNFADRLLERTAARSPLCVGIDPNFALMPASLWPDDNRPATVHRALLRFCQEVIAAVQEQAAVVKFQSAFFEACGAAGVAALADSIAVAKAAGLLVIVDAKRGDIGSTASAYAQAYLGGGGMLANGVTLHSDLLGDALTVNPFLGEDTLEPLIEAAAHHGCGLFILVKTSNPGSGRWQDATLRAPADATKDSPTDNTAMSFSEALAAMVARLGQPLIGRHGYSSIGAVVGATYPDQAKHLRALMPHTPFLIPGLGTQGGSMADALAGFGRDDSGRPTGAIVSASRQITYPSAAEVEAHGFGGAVRQRLATLVTEWQQQVAG